MPAPVGGGVEGDDTHTGVGVEPVEQRGQARSPIAAAAVGRPCADVEHVPMSSTHFVRAGSALIAAAKCYTHNTVDRVFYDEASKLLRPGELFPEPTGCGDAPRSVLAADVTVH
jgi:hypothetical protein